MRLAQRQSGRAQVDTWRRAVPWLVRLAQRHCGEARVGSRRDCAEPLSLQITGWTPLLHLAPSRGDGDAETQDMSPERSGWKSQRNLPAAGFGVDPGKALLGQVGKPGELLLQQESFFSFSGRFPKNLFRSSRLDRRIFFLPRSRCQSRLNRVSKGGGIYSPGCKEGTGGGRWAGVPPPRSSAFRHLPGLGTNRGHAPRHPHATAGSC